MPRRELSQPAQITGWLSEWGARLREPGAMVLIGSAGLLWHAADRGLKTTLPENSMDADPVTEDDCVAELAYDAMIGSEFELEHGWHVNLMPRSALAALPAGWEQRTAWKIYGKLTVTVPAPADLLAPKLQRGEPRDRAHAEWAKSLGLV